MQRLTLPKDTFTWEQRNSWKGRSWEKHRGRLGHISGEGAAGFEATPCDKSCSSQFQCTRTTPDHAVLVIFGPATVTNQLLLSKLIDFKANISG